MLTKQSELRPKKTENRFLLTLCFPFEYLFIHIHMYDMPNIVNMYIHIYILKYKVQLSDMMISKIT